MATCTKQQCENRRISNNKYYLKNRKKLILKATEYDRLPQAKIARSIRLKKNVEGITNFYLRRLIVVNSKSKTSDFDLSKITTKDYEVLRKGLLRRRELCNINKKQTMETLTKDKKFSSITEAITKKSLAQQVNNAPFVSLPIIKSKKTNRSTDWGYTDKQLQVLISEYKSGKNCGQIVKIYSDLWNKRPNTLMAKVANLIRVTKLKENRNISEEKPSSFNITLQKMLYEKTERIEQLEIEINKCKEQVEAIKVLIN